MLESLRSLFFSLLADERGFLRLPGPYLETGEDDFAGGGGDYDDGGDPGGEPAEPEVLEIGEDALFRVPGIDEPIPAKEFRDRFIPQSEYTKQRERDTAETRELRQQLEQQAELNRRYYYQLQQQQRGGAGQQPQAPPPQARLRAIRDRSLQQGFVSAEDFAEALELAATPQIHPQLVQYLQGLNSRYQTLEQQLQGVTGNLTNNRIESTVSSLTGEFEITEQQARDIVQNWEPEAGESFEDMARKLARQYEADNRKLFETVQAKRRKQAQEKKRAGIAGRGGQGSPSGRLKVDPTKPIEDVVAEMQAEGFWKG